MTSWAMYLESGAPVRPNKSDDLLLPLYRKMKYSSRGDERHNFMMGSLVRNCRLIDISTNSSQRQWRL